MHIAFFTNTYLPVTNGVARSVETSREALTAQRHNVFIFAQADSNYVDDIPFIFRYPSLSLPIAVEIPAVIPVSSLVDQLLPILKLNVIHTHHPFLLGQTAASKAKELNLPLIFTFHTQYQEYMHYVPLPQEAIQDFLKGAVKNWLKHFMRLCQHIVIPSESMKDLLIAEYGLRDCYTVIPTGMDLKPFAGVNGSELRSNSGWQADKVLISIGRLGQEKNWPVFLQAAQLVYQQHPDLRVVLIGEGPDRSALETLATELGIAERVTFTGSLPFEEVIKYLKAADLFVFASITETQGLVTMEALAAGLPVVAVDAIGTRDIIDDGKQGFLVPNEAEALAKSIHEVFDSPDLMKKFRRGAIRKARTFDLKHQAKKLVEVYEQAIQDKAHDHHVTVTE
jgi:1,2-diacylglycerol 3-alpha-glucosyltransferase